MWYQAPYCLLQEYQNIAMDRIISYYGHCFARVAYSIAVFGPIL
jgi:hypothetical protein